MSPNQRSVKRCSHAYAEEDGPHQELIPRKAMRRRNCQQYRFHRAETYPSIRTQVSRCDPTKAQAIDWLDNSLEAEGCGRPFDTKQDDVLLLWHQSPHKDTLAFYGVGSPSHQPESVMFNQAVMASLKKAGVDGTRRRSKRPTPPTPPKKTPISGNSVHNQMCQPLILNRQALQAELQQMPIVQQRLHPGTAFETVFCTHVVDPYDPLGVAQHEEEQMRDSRGQALGKERPPKRTPHGMRRRHWYCPSDCGGEQNACSQYEWEKFTLDPRPHNKEFRQWISEQKAIRSPEPKNYDQLYERFLKCFQQEPSPDPLCKIYEICCPTQGSGGDDGQGGGDGHGEGSGRPGGEGDDDGTTGGNDGTGEKDSAKDGTKNKNKVRYNDNDKDKDKDIDKDKDKDKDIDKDKNKDQDKDQDKDLDKDKDKDKDKNKDKDKDKNKDKDKEKDKDKDKDKDQDKDLDKDKDKDKNKDKNKDKDKDKDKDKNKDKNKDKDGGNNEDRNKFNDKDDDKVKNRNKDKIKDDNRDKNKNKDKDTGKETADGKYKGKAPGDKYEDDGRDDGKRGSGDSQKGKKKNRKGSYSESDRPTIIPEWHSDEAIKIPSWSEDGDPDQGTVSKNNPNDQLVPDEGEEGTGFGLKPTDPVKPTKSKSGNGKKNNTKQHKGKGKSRDKDKDEDNDKDIGKVSKSCPICPPVGCPCEICFLTNRYRGEHVAPFIRDMKRAEKKRQLQDYTRQMCHREYIRNRSRQDLQNPHLDCLSAVQDLEQLLANCQDTVFGQKLLHLVENLRRRIHQRMSDCIQPHLNCSEAQFGF